MLYEADEDGLHGDMPGVPQHLVGGVVGGAEQAHRLSVPTREPAREEFRARPLVSDEARILYRSFTRVVENADLRVVRLHDVRHGTAALLSAAGVPPRVVREILGVGRIAVTMNVYTHVVQDILREAVAHMVRLL